MINGKWHRRLASWGAGLAVCLLAASCGEEESLSPSQGPDTLRAFVEGMVVPERDSFEVVLTRGAGELRTMSRAGYFQFSDVPYGLYVLDVSGKGFGGYRRLVTIRERNTALGGIQMETVPWPLQRVYPSDSLVIKAERQSALVQFTFATTMDRQTVEQAVRVDPPVAFGLNWEDRRETGALGDILSVSIDLPDMEYGRAYTVTLDSSAETGLGANLERSVSRTLINRGSTAGNGLATVGSGRTTIGPRDSIPIYFSKAMERISVSGKLVVTPSVAYGTAWDASKTILYLVPATRWPPASSLEIHLNSGYAAQDGSIGQDAAETVRVDPFSIESPSDTGAYPFIGQMEMRFNMPIHLSSLRHRVSGATVSALVQTAPTRLLWSFSGVTFGSAFSLFLDTVLSQYGDTLKTGKVFLLVPKSPIAAFLGPDSTRNPVGIPPWGDTLRLHSLWSTWSRLKDAAFVLSPAYPFSMRWLPAHFDSAILEISFSQPIPSATEFKLMPAQDALPGDTLVFRTSPLAARAKRPYEAEQLVRPDEPVVLEWNTAIDTVGFASRLAFEPAADSLGITHDTAAGGIRTTIRHPPFASATEYTLKVGGVVDLFNRPMRDTLTLRFKTRP